MNMWRCDYCGQQQNASERKCVDCGGPRIQQETFDPRKWEPFAGGRYFRGDEFQAYLTEERVKAQNELRDRISEAQATIGAAFNPIFQRFAYPNEKFDISDRTL